jgi:hypothetical protein
MAPSADLSSFHSVIARVFCWREKMRILLVEDEPRVAHFISKAPRAKLRRRHYRGPRVDDLADLDKRLRTDRGESCAPARIHRDWQMNGVWRFVYSGFNQSQSHPHPVCSVFISSTSTFTLSPPWLTDLVPADRTISDLTKRSGNCLLKPRRRMPSI